MDNLIKQKRRELGLTQAELAKNTGISYASIRAYESDARKPKPSTMKKLADYFDIPVSELVNQTDNVNQDTVSQFIDSLKKAQASINESLQKFNESENRAVQEQISRLTNKKFDTVEATAISNALNFIISAYEMTNKTNKSLYFSTMVTLGQMVDNNNEDYDAAVQYITDLIRFIEKQNKKASDDKPETEG